MIELEIQQHTHTNTFSIYYIYQNTQILLICLFSTMPPRRRVHYATNHEPTHMREEEAHRIHNTLAQANVTP